MVQHFLRMYKVSLLIHASKVWPNENVVGWPIIHVPNLHSDEEMPTSIAKKVYSYDKNFLKSGSVH